MQSPATVAALISTAKVHCKIALTVESWDKKEDKKEWKEARCCCCCASRGAFALFCETSAAEQLSCCPFFFLIEYLLCTRLDAVKTSIIALGAEILFGPRGGGAREPRVGVPASRGGVDAAVFLLERERGIPGQCL
jgi:hypothetical protein